MEIYYKRSCVTCKRTLSDIERMKRDTVKRDFFKEPFSESELKKIIKMSGKKPIELLRKRDKMYKKIKLKVATYSDSQIIRLMLENPGLIMRPIIVTEDCVHVGKIDVVKL